MKTITPFELRRLIDKSSIELIDVRPRREFEKVHPLAARSIPLRDFEPHSVLAHRKLDRNAPLYLICEDRMRASIAAGCLAAAGLESPVVVEGGLKAWKERCLPVVRAHAWPSLTAALGHLVHSWRSLQNQDGHGRVGC